MSEQRCDMSDGPMERWLAKQDAATLSILRIQLLQAIKDEKAHLARLEIQQAQLNLALSIRGHRRRPKGAE